MRAEIPAVRGFMLMDLLVSVMIAGVLVAGTVQLALAAAGSYRLQRDLALLQENSRFILQMIGRDTRHAGYHPKPWQDPGKQPAVSGHSADGFSAAGDRLAFLRWSDRNCYANENPVTDETGAPKYYLMESVFHVTDSGSLAQTCRYGPDAENLTTQINALGLVQNAESMQALYAEDTDGDGNANRWVKAGGWLDESGVIGIRLGILFASPGQFGVVATGDLDLLDESIPVPSDGRLRRTVSTTIAIRGRSG